MTEITENADQQELFQAVEADLREVPLDEIEPTGDTTASLQNAITNLGTVSTPVLQLDNEQEEEQTWTYRIVDGRRRIATLREMGEEEVEAYCVPPEMEAEADALTAAMNIVREPNPIVEARSIANLIENRGYTPDALSRIGIPKQTVKKRMRLWSAPDAIKVGVRVGEIAEGTAEKVANLSKELQEECASFYKDEEKLRRKDVRRIRQADVEETADEMPNELFDTPDVSREESEESVSGGESAAAGEAGGKGEVTPNALLTGVEIPTDADAFEDYTHIAGAVREYVTSDTFDDASEAIEAALSHGDERGLAPGEVAKLLMTPPAHFLRDEAMVDLLQDL